MLKRFKKIKNLGVFKDYTWNTEIPDFKKFNLIYGWNGCGKTTLSNLFNLLEPGAIGKYPELEYEIETEEGNIKQGEPYSRKIRVFNQTYIANNVQMLVGKANPIYILGEENKKIADAIEKDEKEIDKKKVQLKKIKDNFDSLEKERNKKFTDIARIISANTSGEATRKYNKLDAEEAFSKLVDKELLQSPQIDKYNLTLRQIEKAPLNELTLPKIKYKDKEFNLDDVFGEIINDAKALCERTVESIIIERLKQNPDISAWVESGISLHSTHKSEICEFCNQSLPKNRISELAKYFNEADKKLKDQIDNLLQELRLVYSILDEIHPLDKANLYEELQNQYQINVEGLEVEKKKILEQIIEMEVFLNDKKSKTTQSVQFALELDATPFKDLLEKIGVDIKKHNNKTSNFKNEKEISQKALEKHYLSSIYDEVKDLDTKITIERENIRQMTDGIIELSKKIIENKSRISSSHKACKAINDGLKTFLGRDEIVFEVENDGYVIKRNGKIAENLSEGEKTAIAFVYFTVHLQDQDFNIKEGILVIDDPISSLDSNSLFQAFSFLKNSVKDANQVFISTHNFDFLKLLLNWLKYDKNRPLSNFYMINNIYINNERQALIAKLDKDLEGHESEYHYLFKKLFNYVSDGTIETAYNMPNISRKVMETFLMFRVPSNEGYYKKLDSLKGSFEENKITSIYKFTNDQSHITGKGFDPSLVQETQKNVKYLLEMIKTTFPEHYEILVRSIAN